MRLKSIASLLAMFIAGKAMAATTLPPTITLNLHGTGDASVQLPKTLHWTADLGDISGGGYAGSSGYGYADASGVWIAVIDDTTQGAAGLATDSYSLDGFDPYAGTSGNGVEFTADASVSGTSLNFSGFYAYDTGNYHEYTGYSTPTASVPESGALASVLALIPLASRPTRKSATSPTQPLDSEYQRMSGSSPKMPRSSSADSQSQPASTL